MEEKKTKSEAFSEGELNAEQEALLAMMIKEKIKEDALLIALTKLGGELILTRDELAMIKNYHFHMISLTDDKMKLTLEIGKVCSDNITTH